MMISWMNEPPRATRPAGFVYVGQDTYVLGPRDGDSARYFYSDSATSCIILILEGGDRAQRPLVALTHLSCAERLHAFFDLVESQFCGPVALFALGAHPPSDEASQRNCRVLMAWMLAHAPNASTSSSGWWLSQTTLALGFRVPDRVRSGCAGIDLHTGIVSTQAYALTEQQRDPTGGVQTLFTMFGLALRPPLVLREVGQEFSPAEIESLVQLARNAHWEQIAGLDDGALLALFSSTPDDELPWFAAGLRASADYVRSHRRSSAGILR
jgi:hypothetical protein